MLSVLSFPSHRFFFFFFLINKKKKEKKKLWMWGLENSLKDIIFILHSNIPMTPTGWLICGANLLFTSLCHWVPPKLLHSYSNLQLAKASSVNGSSKRRRENFAVYLNHHFDPHKRTFNWLLGMFSFCDVWFLWKIIWTSYNKRFFEWMYLFWTLRFSVSTLYSVFQPGTVKYTCLEKSCCCFFFFFFFFFTE